MIDFSHSSTQFSIGILYLVIGNLPRELHYKRENILIVGIMPGPNEPSKDINTYLEPLVIEMEKLWNGTSSCKRASQLQIDENTATKL